ncbi:uncharacterized pyridoxal phosphate-dependent enzyme [Pantoea agglomerans]|uniref:Uncharacterized pyridoxal phosphate-dependent enzyme n=1 Tax=Enterobacter agglomerans TaxID=549 RepID=A0A379ABH7_ENTAG|nr:uncharacterized pyridoxal phosphate-dependent enzyme [Pantoea agglomerans]
MWRRAAAVARQHGVPLIVDAAAEEDLQCYYQAGARSGDLQRSKSD